MFSEKVALIKEGRFLVLQRPRAFDDGPHGPGVLALVRRKQLRFLEIPCVARGTIFAAA